jgi:hypothetical protein
MIKVENFYWVLFNTLLKPVGLDCRYFYPFGTTEHFIEFQHSAHPFICPERASLLPSTIRHRSHALFHFDQEPIYEESDQTIFRGSQGSHFLRTRILANSEISEIKRTFCKTYQLLDWFFFYHGFAALDWYQDSAYIDYDDGFSHAFLSLNHVITHRRSYRMALTARLIQKGIIADGLVSFHGNREACEIELRDCHTLLPESDRLLIDQFLLPSKIPFTVDSARVDSSYSARFGPDEYSMRQKGFVHVVNETVFYDSKLHLTEKVFQPIVVMRPFVLVAAPGNLAFLRSYGFRTFSDWIDESYDTIQDPTSRLDAIANVLQDLVSLPRSELDKMFASMKDTLLYNKKHFFGEFRRMIVHEMVDNFDTCIRIWNNGRVDDRALPRHPDLEGAKEVLLR